MPVLPFIEDNENNILEIVKKAADSGARGLFIHILELHYVIISENIIYSKLDSIFPQYELFKAI